MTYTDANTIHDPTTGQVIPAAWGDQIRANQEFFVDPPACSIYSATAQTVANGAATGVDLVAASENFDNDSMHSTSSATERITCQTAGRYLLVATVNFASNTSGSRRVAFLLNGATTYGASVAAPAPTNSTVLTAVRAIILVAGDYVTCNVWQTSGGNLDVTLVEFAATYLTR